MSKPISIQLYTLRQACAADFPGTLREVAKIGYKGVEFAGFHGMAAAAVARLVKDLGLTVSSSHVGMPDGSNIRELADQEKTLGNNLVISGVGPDGFKTVDDCKRTAERFQEASRLCAEHGLKMGYHNHWWEFHRVDGRLGYDFMMEAAPDLLAEVDVYWVAYGKAHAEEVVRQYRTRIPVLHIKDGPLEEGKKHTAVGAGKMNIPAVIAAADPAILEWLIVELDDCDTDMMQAVRDSYRYMTTAGLALGNV
ncbi:MAG TPA: sugar phosphate isomerase/epimerase [Armatimonadota bacterium]|nr:sugar phosphate isomerase/epimerase [Armatimonadota bacterium]